MFGKENTTLGRDIDNALYDFFSLNECVPIQNGSVVSFIQHLKVVWHLGSSVTKDSENIDKENFSKISFYDWRKATDK